MAGYRRLICPDSVSDPGLMELRIMTNWGEMVSHICLMLHFIA